MSPIISTDQEEKINRTVLRYRLTPIFAVLLLVFIMFNIVAQLAQYSVWAAEDYTLPYPGILPNHQLYPLKIVRDRLLEFFTREPIKKAELYLLYADKRINMARMLAEEKDWELAEQTASKAEKYLLEVNQWTNNARGMGHAPEVDLENRIKKAGTKHKEILQALKKQAPKEQQGGFGLSLKLNQQYQDWAKQQ